MHSCLQVYTYSDRENTLCAVVEGYLLVYLTLCDDIIYITFFGGFWSKML